MSREHKFRVWDKILQCYSKNTMGLFHNEGVITFDVGTRYIFEQYTGINDNKRTVEYPDGQTLYEGDIVTFEGFVSNFYDEDEGRRKILTGEVFYKTEGSVDCCFRVDGHNYGLNSNDVGKYELVGDIHRNPELLTDRQGD